MPNISRDGHRERLRKSYINGDMDNAPDHNLLELFLTGIIPRKDVKPLAYDLLNYFGSLEKVIDASPHELMEVNGIGEATAIQISLIKKIYSRVIKNRNKDIKILASNSIAIKFCKNLLQEEMVEKAYLICLDGNYRLLGVYYLGSGNRHNVQFNSKEILKHPMRDNASFVYLTHNHPNQRCEPSCADIDTTSRLKMLLAEIKIVLIDHIVVGSDGCSLIIEDGHLANRKIFKK